MSRAAINGQRTRSTVATRSRVTNGKSLFVEAPGDNAWARRFRDLYAEIVADIGADADALSEGQRQLARRCATLSILCERMEAKVAAGTEVDAGEYGALVDRLGRCLQRLGLKRKQHAAVDPLTYALTYARPPSENGPLS